MDTKAQDTTSNTISTKAIELIAPLVHRLIGLVYCDRHHDFMPYLIRLPDA